MVRIVALMVSCFMVSCTHPQETRELNVKTTPPLSGEGKPTAPVEIKAELRPSGAHIRVTFEAQAEEAQVTVSGLDGLQLAGARALTQPLPRAYQAHEVAELDVSFSGPAGTLVVNVAGTFNGAPRNRVATFSMGEGAPASSGTKVTPENAPAFKVLP